MGFNPHTHGSFVEERRCTCGESKLFSKEARRVECDFMDRTGKRWSNAGRVTVGVGSAALAFIPFVGIPLAIGALAAQAPTWGQDLTHTALEVLYKCRSCGHEVHVTYEIIKEGVVSNAAGRYTKPYERPLVSSKNESFVDIERLFREMPKGYNMVYNNCKQWTDGLTFEINNIGVLFHADHAYALPIVRAITAQSQHLFWRRRRVAVSGTSVRSADEAFVQREQRRAEFGDCTDQLQELFRDNFIYHKGIKRNSI